MSNESRTALVTGASRGIGRATAVAFAEAGFDVAITARTVVDGDPSSLTDDGKVLPGSLASTAAAIEALGQRAVQVPLDLLDRDALVPAVESAISGLGHLDVVVNNAIYVTGGGPKYFLDTDPDDLVNQMWGDLTAQLLLLQPQVAHMVSRGGGVVINIGSGSGKWKLKFPIGQGGPQLAYCAATWRDRFTRCRAVGCWRCDYVAGDYGGNDRKERQLPRGARDCPPHWAVAAASRN